jgi:hypothetical protein
MVDYLYCTITVLYIAVQNQFVVLMPERSRGLSVNKHVMCTGHGHYQYLHTDFGSIGRLTFSCFPCILYEQSRKKKKQLVPTSLMLVLSWHSFSQLLVNFCQLLPTGWRLGDDEDKVKETPRMSSKEL